MPEPVPWTPAQGEPLVRSPDRTTTITEYAITARDICSALGISAPHGCEISMIFPVVQGVVVNDRIDLTVKAKKGVMP